MAVKYKCLICLDKGFIVYNKKVDDKIYQYVSHCICEKSLDFRYDGNKCGERKSPYYIASIERDFDLKELIKENLAFLCQTYGEEKVLKKYKNAIPEKGDNLD